MYIVAGVVLLPGNAWGKSKVKDAARASAPDKVRVMVVGLPGNVCSNYYPISMISEETGIPSDSVAVAYNNAIAQNIVSTNKSSRISFFIPANKSGVNDVTSKIDLKGDVAEDRQADLSRVGAETFRRLLSQNNADYVLFLNQHYLKWQEKPMQTLFHITSYSLYNNDMQEVAHGNNNFASFDLESAEKLHKDARKSSSKILSAVVKNLSR